MLISLFNKLGWNIPEREQSTLAIRDSALQKVLDAKLDELSCKTMEGNITKIEGGADHSVVTLENGNQVKARTIFATKYESAIEKYGEFNMKHTFYQQKLLSSFISLADDLNEAYVRSYPGGFVSLIPLENKQAYVKWCFGGSDHEDPSGYDKELYVKKLNEKFQQVADMDTQKWVGTPLSYPPLLIEEQTKRTRRNVVWAHPNQLYNKNVILVADAAHEFYPFLMHETNIGFNEIASISNMFSQAGGSFDQSSASNYSTASTTQANTYGYFQHYANYITQSSSSTLKSLQALGAGILSYVPLGAYLLNEVAHGGITPPFSFGFRGRTGKPTEKK